MLVCVCWCSQVMMHLLQPHSMSDFYWVSTIVKYTSQAIHFLRQCGLYKEHWPLQKMTFTGLSHMCLSVSRRYVEPIMFAHLWVEYDQNHKEISYFIVIQKPPILRRSFMLISVYCQRYTHFQALWAFSAKKNALNYLWISWKFK